MKEKDDTCFVKKSAREKRTSKFYKRSARTVGPAHLPDDPQKLNSLKLKREHKDVMYSSDKLKINYHILAC